MGELYFIVNLDKREYYSNANKWREWELNPKELVPLFNLLGNEWKGDRIAVIGEYSIEKYGELENITKRIKKEYEDLLR